MEDVYPYYLKPDKPFHIEPLPIYSLEQNVDCFYKYKRSYENLYIGNINKEHLLLKPSHGLLNEIKPFLVNHKRYLRVIDVNDRPRRILPKICWLTDSFFKNKLEHPVCVHYNPRIQQNVIHPGAIRIHVLTLFQETEAVNCFYFNTGGVHFDFMESLKILDQDELLKLQKNMQVVLMADHGSIIPHVNLDPQSNDPAITRWTEFICKRLADPNFKISTNYPIVNLLPWTTENNDSTVEIRLDDSVNELHPQWEDIVCKCIILSIIGKPYKSPLLNIEHKLNVMTP
jgi:hypothetical protein